MLRFDTDKSRRGHIRDNTPEVVVFCVFATMHNGTTVQRLDRPVGEPGFVRNGRVPAGTDLDKAQKEQEQADRPSQLSSMSFEMLILSILIVAES